MAKFLYNSKSYVLLFKGGNLEIHPNTYKAVTDVDYSSGMFEGEILRGDLTVHDSIPDVKPKVSASIGAPLETLSSDPGASPDELRAFLAAQKAKQENQRSKYEQEAIDTGAPSVNTPSVTEVVTDSGASQVVGKETLTKAKSGRKTTPITSFADLSPA